MNLAPNVLVLCVIQPQINVFSVLLYFKIAILVFPLPVWSVSIGTYSNRIQDLENVVLSYQNFLIGKLRYAWGVNDPPPWALGVS